MEGGGGPEGCVTPLCAPPSDAEAAGEPRGGQKALRLSRGCQAPGAPRGPAEWEPCHCSSPSSSPSSDEDEQPAPAPGAAALSPFRSPRPGGEAPTATDTEEREGSDTCNPLSGGDGTWGASHFSASCSAWAKHLPKPHLLLCTLISPTRSCSILASPAAPFPMLSHSCSCIPHRDSTPLLVLCPHAPASPLHTSPSPCSCVPPPHPHPPAMVLHPQFLLHPQSPMQLLRPPTSSFLHPHIS